jgi:hypothetical protein
MGNFTVEPGFHNVYATPRIGRLDRTSEAEAWHDVALIRTYIRAEKEVAAASGRTPPSIARAVLTSIWETPRIGFHREVQKSFPAEAGFRNKLLWTPWSIEAADRWNETHSVKGLILEHVTPIDWMWRQLTKLHDEFEDPTSDFHPDPEWGGASHIWEHHAAEYLINHWMVAVLTEEQSTAIDSYPGFKKTGFEPNPFERYWEAEKAMNRDRANAKAEQPPPFSTAKFIISGHEDHIGR